MLLLFTRHYYAQLNSLHTHKTIRTGISAHYKRGVSFPVSRCTKLFTVFDVNNQTHKDNARWHVLISQSSASTASPAREALIECVARRRRARVWLVRYLRARTAVAQGLRGS